MRVLIEIGHPGHVHLFRHVSAELERRGHEICVASRDKDVTIALLDEFGIEHTSLSRQGKGLLGLAWEMLVRDWRLLRLARAFRPDIFVSLSMCSAHVGAVLRRPVIMLDDTEHARIERVLWRSLATKICTPAAYALDLGPKHQRYAGCHELAYLHPNRFTPNASVLGELGLSQDDRYFVLRFVAFQAAHDAHRQGLDDVAKRALVTALEHHGTVFITSEAAVPDHVGGTQLDIVPTRMHDVLYYASLFVGEGGTMATEAALLGTPCVHYRRDEAPGIHAELASQFGLMTLCSEPDEMMSVALRLGTDLKAKSRQRQRRKKMLEDRIDVTAWLVDYLEAQADDR